MIPRPTQQDRDSAAEYLRNVSKQIIQAKENINVYRVFFPGVIDEIVPAAIKNINEQLVSLLEAYLHNADNENPSVMIEKAASAENAAIEASLPMWEKLAHIAYDEAVRVTEKKSKRSVANIKKAIRLKLEGKKFYDSANNFLSQDKKNDAVQDYKKAVDILRESKEEAEVAMASVSGQSRLSRQQNRILLFTLVVAIITIIVTARGCRVESNQIPNSSTVQTETAEPNLSK